MRRGEKFENPHQVLCWVTQGFPPVILYVQQHNGGMNAPVYIISSLRLVILIFPIWTDNTQHRRQQQQQQQHSESLTNSFFVEPERVINRGTGRLNKESRSERGTAKLHNRMFLQGIQRRNICLLILRAMSTQEGPPNI